MSAKNIPRRQAVPVLYTRGTHYEVGFDMGRTFASVIKNFLLLSGPLNEVYLPLYATEKGKNAYNETLESVKNSFPQYIRELEGVAEGAQVEFHKLFLLHMDDILPQSVKHLNSIKKQPVGCSTIIVNGEHERVLGHTEDALTETLNHYYFVVAHIINETPQGKYNVKEERFMSLCYAGHLPGYTMNYNHHGLVFSINTLSAEVLRSGKTPRHFVTRALLSADNSDQALKILRDAGVGAGDGCSINMCFINDPSNLCYNIEMAPTEGNTKESTLNIRKIQTGEHSYHANKYERIEIEQANQIMLDSSISRMNTFGTYEPAKSKQDVINMLGDCSGGEHCVFREDGNLSQEVKTIAVGIFDMNEKTVALYSDTLEMDFVKNRLLEEERKRMCSSNEDPVESVAMKVSFKFKCHYCGKIGHKKKNCFKFKRDQSEKSGNVANSNLCFIADEECYTSQVNSNMKWIVDSGASDHMANDERFFFELHKLDNAVIIGVAKDGVSIVAEKCGTIVGYVKVNGKFSRCSIKNVLLCKDLKCNLFSIRRIEEAGMKAVFENKRVKIFKGHTLMLEGDRQNKTYEFQLNYENANANLSNHQQVADLWHQRLCHLNEQDMKKLKAMVNGMDDIKDHKPFCESCVFGKQHRLPFKGKKDKEYSLRPLQLIHSDVCGPLTPNSWDGKKYIVTFIDDYSHFTCVYIMANKSEVLTHFKNYKVMAENLHGTKISKLKCDNGGEYSSNAFKDFCRNSGITIQYTHAYTPEQNGKSERMNRTLIEKARSMISKSGVPKYLWSEAIYCANYVTNRSPTSSLSSNKTPAEVWSGNKPNLSNLRVFGCAAYSHIPKAQRTKLDMKSRKLLMIGYSGNGYRLWDTAGRKLVLSRYVLFNETEFNNPLPVRKDVSIVLEKSYKENENSLEQSTGTEEENSEDEIFEETVNFPEEPNMLENGDIDPVVLNESTEPTVELRRSTRTINPPRRFHYMALALSAEQFVSEVPTRYEDVENCVDADEWYAAINSELNSLSKNNTWELVQRPNAKSVVSSKWVFRRKLDENGNPGEYKARVVARGFTQCQGFDYNETYSPVARIGTFRILLAVANKMKYIIHQMDVKTVFLNGYLREEIYMDPPKGLECKSNVVCKLNRSLYGLKQSPRMWNERFNSFILSLNFIRSKNDYCLYIRTDNGNVIYLLLYVDDLLIVGNNMKAIQDLKLQLKSEFEMKDMGDIDVYLGIKVNRNIEESTIEMTQKGFIVNLLKKLGMENCKNADTPMEPKLSLPNDINEKTQLTKEPYKELIGCLMYLMLTSRPDISVSVNYLSRFQNCATACHWSHLKRILRYLKKTKDMKFLFDGKSDETLFAYCDADWGNDTNDRKSLSGYLVKLFGSTVSWSTKKQPTVSLSSTEAEYIALCITASEIMYLLKLLQDLNINIDLPITIYEDNMSCIKIAEEPKEHQRMKHIDIKYHFLRDLVQDKIINIVYKSSKEQGPARSGSVLGP